MPALPLLAHTLRRASTRLASSAPLPIRSCSKARVLSSAADTCFTSGRVAPPAASPPAPGQRKPLRSNQIGVAPGLRLVVVASLPLSFPVRFLVVFWFGPSRAKVGSRYYALG